MIWVQRDIRLDAVSRGFHLVTRDVDLLCEIGRSNVVGVNLTITTLDEKLARLLEPRAPRPQLRLDTVRKLRAASTAAPNPFFGTTPARSYWYEAQLSHLGTREGLLRHLW